MKLERWSLRTDGLRKRKAWGKKEDPYPLIKVVNIKRLLIIPKCRESS